MDFAHSCSQIVPKFLNGPFPERAPRLAPLLRQVSSFALASLLREQIARLAARPLYSPEESQTNGWLHGLSGTSTYKNGTLSDTDETGFGLISNYYLLRR